MKGSISCVYQTGARSVLWQDWQAHNACFTRESKIYFVEKGEIVIQIYGQTITAGPGDLLLIPAQVVHSFWLPEGGYAEKFWCHFELKNSSGEFFKQFVLEPVVKVTDHELIRKLFQQLLSSHEMPAPQKDLVATTAICSLVQYYFEHSNVSVNNLTANRIQKVIDYISKHYMERISLEQLAEIACYSPKHLSKRFRETTGLPPIRYLNAIRIERARYLLQYSDEPIGQIMEKCGFTEAAYFSRVFKKTLGYSPQMFRELCNSQLPQE